MSEQNIHTQLSDFCKVYPNVITAENCQKLIDYFENNEDKWYLGAVGGNEGTEVNTEKKFVQQINVAGGTYEDQLIQDAVGTAFRKYVGDNPHYPIPASIDNGYGIKRYEMNKHFYDWHVDNSVEYHATRVIAVLIYLNTVDEGGETEFEFGTKIKPVQGSALVFPANWMFPHRGCMPLSEHKYLANTFICFHPSA